MTSIRRPIRIGLALLFLAPSSIVAQSGHDLFQQALLQERAYGNLEQAVELYERIVSEFSEDRKLTATTLVQLRSVYEKLGISEAPSPRIDPTYTFILDDIPIGRLDLPASYDFSPDGEQVVFRSQMTSERPPGLYVADREGAVVRPLITLDSVLGPTEGLWSPRWSPDGTRIAFMARFPERDQAMGIYVIDPERGTVERIGESFEGNLSWTPDGSAVTHLGAPHGRLETFAVTGQRGEGVIGDALPQSTVLGGYSPDGTWIALDIRSELLGREMRDIWVVAADGRGRFHVTDSPGLDANPTWGMDGSLYFVSDRSGSANIWRLGIEAISGRRYPPARRRSEARPGRGWSSRVEVGLPGQVEQATFFDGARVAHPRAIANGGIAFVLQNVTRTIQVATASSPLESRTIARGRNPQLSPNGDRVYFEGKGAGEGGVFAVSRDGGVPVRVIRELSPGGRWSSRLSISPDGAALTYANVGAQGWEISVVSTGGGPPRQITSLPRNELSYPVWSPDGTRIAFASGRGLYVLSWDSGQRTRLAELRTWDTWSVRWSPDGEYLAALGWGEPRGQVEPPNHVYVVPASGGELRQLTPDDERQYKEGLEWHPNGNELTYMYHAPDFEGDGLRTAYLDGRPSTLFIDEPATWDYVGTWAPDGSAYYFMASDRARPGWQLYRRDSEGGAIVEVLSGDDLSLPRWSRDGQTMVWSVEQVKSQLWVMEIEE